ncbi:MAG: hypothetical protein ABS75_00400 [Pelagibacterium sp. SCN 63-23]|nr:MAG: hypothetical protein ABS75_00400 [Pelagibacterium sp. SCN 63-23]
MSLDGLVQGGRVNLTSGLLGAGVRIKKPVQTLPDTSPNSVIIGESGSVGALSDHALFLDGGSATVVNSGTVTGFLTFGDGNDKFENDASGSWNIRNSQATTNPLVRDTENIAISNFGGQQDVVINNGVVRLLTVENPASLEFASSLGSKDVAKSNFPEATDPAENYTIASISKAGIEQAQLLNLESFVNAGLITMADAETGGARPVAGDALFITGGEAAGVAGEGEFVSAGGRVNIDTVLNDGVSDETDLLVIDHATIGSGSTTLSIANASPGRGASTDVNGNGTFDDGEGILVVQALERGSQENAFVLGGSVVDGAFKYSLEQTDGQSWYLQSDYLSQVATYEAYGQHLLGLLRVPTMRQRIGGEGYWYDEATREGAFGVRTKIEAAHSKDTSRPLSATGTSFEQTKWGLQTDLDMLLYDGDDGSQVLGGLTGHYGTAASAVEGRVGAGSINTTGYGVGGTLSWFGASGGYVDLQGATTWFDSGLADETAGTLVNGNKGFGYALSAEIGRTFDWYEGWSLTPQAQVVYTKADFEPFTGPSMEQVLPADSDDLRIRLGLAADRNTSWLGDNGLTQSSHLYVGASLIHDFDATTATIVSNTPVDFASDNLAGEFEVTVERDFDDNSYALYGEAHAGAGLGSFGDSYSVGGTVGVKFRMGS